MYFTNTAETESEKTPSGNSVWRLLSEKIGVPNFELRYFEIPPGGHTSRGGHPWEHEVYVVAGNGIVRGRTAEGQDIEREVEPGDAIYIAPDEDHQFLNEADIPFGFICVCPAGYE